MLINALKVTKTSQRYDESFITALAHRSVSANLRPCRRIPSSGAMRRSPERRRIWGARDQAQHERHPAANQRRRGARFRSAPLPAPPGRSPPVSQCDGKSTRRGRNARAARQGTPVWPLPPLERASEAESRGSSAHRSKRAQGGGRESDEERG